MTIRFLGFIPFLIFSVIVLYNLATAEDDHDVIAIFLGFVLIIASIGGLVWVIS